VVDDLHAGEERVEVGRDELSSATKVVRAVAVGARSAGSISLGTLTRAKVVTCVCGSRTSTASDSDRLEM
jgi:hypothetical protein